MKIDVRMRMVIGVVGALAIGACEKSTTPSVSPDVDDAGGKGRSAGQTGGEEAPTYTRVLVDWPDVSKPSKRVGGGENDAAVIVGIEGYARVQAVPGAIDNALAWHKHLVDGLGVPVDRVKVLTDDAATKGNIEKALAAAAKTAGASGRVWFVFIGHGAPSKDASDGLLLDVDVQQTADSLEERGVRRSTAVALLEKSRAQPVLVLDACFSGRTGSGEALAPGLMPLVVAKLAPPKRAVVLSAALSDQFAGGLPGAVRPAFSYLVLGALRGWADGDGDGVVTATEVLGFAGTAMKATIDGREQTPELSGNAEVMLGKHLGDKAPDLTEIVAQLRRGNTVKLTGSGVVLTDLPSLRLGDITREGLQEGVDISKIDMAKEREMERQFLALQDAKAKVDQAKEAKKNDPSGEKQEAAWCELAEIGDPNPYRADARKACTQMRNFVEQRKRLMVAMDHDWREIIVPFVGLKSRSVDDKKRVVAAFVAAYGALAERPEIEVARAAHKSLAGGSFRRGRGRTRAQ